MSVIRFGFSTMPRERSKRKSALPETRDVLQPGLAHGIRAGLLWVQKMDGCAYGLLRPAGPFQAESTKLLSQRSHSPLEATALLLVVRKARSGSGPTSTMRILRRLS